MQAPDFYQEENAWNKTDDFSGSAVLILILFENSFCYCYRTVISNHCNTLNCWLTTYFQNNYLWTGWLITCCLTVLVSQSSSCPDTGIGSRETESLLPDRLTAAAEQTKDEPLGLQAKDRILRDTGRTYYYQNLSFNNKYFSLLRAKIQILSNVCIVYPSLRFILVCFVK